MTRKIKEDTYMDTAADCEECDEDVLFFLLFFFYYYLGGWGGLSGGWGGFLNHV
jgi:hypothetical protein